MRFLIIFIIFVHALYFTACHGFLDIETTTKNAVLPKSVRNFVRIKLNRTETLNEKNYNDRTTTLRQEDSTSHQIIDTTMTADLTTTKESEFLDTTTTEKISTRHPITPDQNIPNMPDVESRSVFWFFGGALAGIVLSSIIFSIYSFYKSRTESFYQDL